MSFPAFLYHMDALERAENKFKNKRLPFSFSEKSRFTQYICLSLKSRGKKRSESLWFKCVIYTRESILPWVFHTKLCAVKWNEMEWYECYFGPQLRTIRLYWAGDNHGAVFSLKLRFSSLGATLPLKSFSEMAYNDTSFSINSSHQLSYIAEIASEESDPIQIYNLSCSLCCCLPSVRLDLPLSCPSACSYSWHKLIEPLGK